MAKYLIHTCKDRYWYVRYYLVPSLKKQGITKDEILVYNDKCGDGQLTSLIKSYDLIGDEDAWHLQDDVIISKHFKEVADEHEKGIVCGFCNSFSRGYPGYANIYSMWYSMPCIRIPGAIFKEFIDWLKTAETQRRLKLYVDENKHDDVLLEIFLKENYPKLRVWNIAPNMVNHIDHLMGGSLINRGRSKEPHEIMATYWDEPELLEDITRKLKERRG